MRAVTEAHYERTPTPMIAEVLKRRMFALHCEDPAVWTADKISRTFGLPRPRVRAILTLARMEADAYPDGSRPALLDGSVESMLEAKFGVLLPGTKTKVPLRDEKYITPHFAMLDEDVGSLQEYGWQQQRRAANAPATELAETPPPEFAAFRDAVQVAPAPAGAAARKFRMVCIDSSKRFQDHERPIVVEEQDGSLRTVDWTERRSLMSIYRGRRRKLHKSFKGGLKMDVMLDYDKFYMDDVPIGMPDQWPNNQRPPPSEREKTMSRLEAMGHWQRVRDQGKALADKAKTPAAAAPTETTTEKQQ